MFSIHHTLAHFGAYTLGFHALHCPICASCATSCASTDLLRVSTTILGVTLTLILCALIKRELRRYLRKA